LKDPHEGDLAHGIFLSQKAAAGNLVAISKARADDFPLNEKIPQIIWQAALVYFGSVFSGSRRHDFPV
jgi:hypothetical protein